MPAVGIADTNNLFGALEFSLAARSGVQPVIGVQIGLRTDAGGNGRQMQGGSYRRMSSYCSLSRKRDTKIFLLWSMSLSESVQRTAQIDIEDLAERNGDVALTGGASDPVGH